MISAIHYDKTKGEEYRIPCAKCSTPTFHKVLSSVDVEIGLISAKAFENYQVMQCQGGKDISFRKGSNHPVLYPQATAKSRRISSEELYPSRVAGRYSMASTYLLPESVAKIYHETHIAICNKQPVLAGIGIRALVETVCKDKAAGGRNLEVKIDKLAILGLLTKDNAEFLHGLRILGNKAAHEVKPHDEETLGAAMDVVEHLLKTVYVLPVQAKNLPRR